MENYNFFVQFFIDTYTSFVDMITSRLILPEAPWLPQKSQKKILIISDSSSLENSFLKQL